MNIIPEIETDLSDIERHTVYTWVVLQKPVGMCTFDILASSPNGYIARCNRCRSLEMAFGTSLAFFPDSKLAAFLSHIRGMLEDAEEINPIQKKVILNLASTEALQMILTPMELRQLFDMLDRALDEMHARSILNLFNPSEAP